MDDDISPLSNNNYGIVNQEIPQFDGNITIDTDSITSEISCSCCNTLLNSSMLSTNDDYQHKPNHIPTQVGYRPARVINERPQHSRKVIRRDNKNIQALTIPNMTNYNIRALFPKIDNFARDMEERESDLSFITEVWQKLENKKHQFKLEELLEMRGIKYISTPRPGARRGGGAAIAVRMNKFSISKLNIPLPRAVEVVWGLLKPKVVTGKISTIIVCCFYSPPNSKKNRVLIDHLTVTLQSLLSKHPNAGVIISGDRNSIDISSLLSIDPSLRQTVREVTRGQKILDVIVTNLARYFNETRDNPTNYARQGWTRGAL